MVSLNSPDWLTSPSTRRVMQALDGARPGGARFVGGCVRNSLLGQAVSDIDIATQLLPEEAGAAAEAAGCAVHPTGVAHGTITVVADGHPFEVTTLRRDVETDGRRAVVAFTEDWAEDAQRRDFRMNALYASCEGEVFDPTGGGLDDIAARRIVFVGDAETRIREDYLRILRFFRFYAWYGAGAPDADGLAACARLRSGLAGISAERIWAETKKLLKASDPRASLLSMRESGVLHQLYTETARLDDALAMIAADLEDGRDPDALLRFAALLRADPESARKVLSGMKPSNAERARIRTALGLLDLDADVAPHELRRTLYRHGFRAVADHVLLARAQDGAHADRWLKLLAAAEAWTQPTFPVTGDDALKCGLKSGPAIGAALSAVEAAWIDSDFMLERPELLARLQEIAAAGE